MQKSIPRLSAVLAVAVLLCQACASTPKPNPNASATAIMNPAPAAASATNAAIAKASKTGVMLDRVVAVVNDEVILQSELDARVATATRQIQAQGTAIPPENILRKQVLDQMIMTKLELQQAANKGITVSDDTLNQTLNRIAERNGFSLNQLPEKLAQQGIDYTEFRQDLRDQLVIHNLEQQLVSSQMHITPREVQAQIDADQANGNANNQYHISQILIATPANPTTQQVEEARKKALDVYQKLKKGADFAAMAVEYSQGQQALKGGDLGWRKGSELPTIFATIIGQMKPGEVTEPLASSSGFHILKLDDVKSADNKVMVTQTHVRDILLKPSAIMTDTQVKAKLEDLRKQILGGADFTKLAEKFSEDPESASSNGDLGWMDPDARGPDFQSQMDKLQVGEISEPFQTQFGWFILQVLGRRQVDQTQQYTSNKAYQAIYARKSEEIIQQWLTALRGSAYIEYYLKS